MRATHDTIASSDEEYQAELAQVMARLDELLCEKGLAPRAASLPPPARRSRLATAGGLTLLAALGATFLLFVVFQVSRSPAI